MTTVTESEPQIIPDTSELPDNGSFLSMFLPFKGSFSKNIYVFIQKLYIPCF